MVDTALGNEKPVVPVMNQDEILQLRLKEQYEVAYRQGEAMGRKTAQAELEEKMKGMSRAIENAASHKSRLRQEAERDVVSLALAVARRVLHRQIQVDEEAILGLVKAAFDNASLREITHVRIHPQFVSAVQNHLQSVGAPVSIQLTGDASLELGGVIVETARGCLDASVDTQLDEISRGFRNLSTTLRHLPALFSEFVLPPAGRVWVG
jgi:flagellar assembly protein FliH